MTLIRSILDRLRAVFVWWFADIRRRPSAIGKLASLGIGLIVLCCACSFGLFAVDSAGQAVGLVATNTPRPPPTSTPAPTNTPAPTVTPQPSATSLPSATPRPVTATIEPTVTPAAKFSTQEIQAVASIGEYVGEIGKAIGEIGTLAQNYENTDSWKIDMAVQITIVQTAHQALLNLDVPPKIGGLRGATVNATTDCNAAMDKLISGIDTNSAVDLRKAIVLMNSCGQKIRAILPEIQALQDS